MNNNRLDNFFWIIILVFTAYGILMLVACWSMFCKTTEFEPAYKVVPHTTDTLRMVVSYDNVPVKQKNVNHRVDSMIAQQNERLFKLEYQTQVINDYNQHIVNDLRQETNNFLDKSNAWLAFWIATSAILCIVVPIVFQHMISRADRRRFEEMVREATNQLKTLRENTEMRHRLWRIQWIIENGIESKLFNPVARANHAFTTYLWHELCNSFSILISRALSDSVLSRDQRFELMQYLLDMDGYIMKLRRGMIFHRNRTIITLDDNIHQLYRQLENQREGTIDNLREQFQQILGGFRSLPADIREG